MTTNHTRTATPAPQDRTSSPAARQPGPRGRVDAIDAQLNVQGWASSDDAKHVDVELLVDGKIAAVARANRPRPDLKTAGIEDERAGFRVAVPPRFIAGPDVEIEVSVMGHLLPSGLGAVSLAQRINFLDLKIDEGELYIRVADWPGDTLEVDLYADGIFMERVQLTRDTNESATVSYCWPLPVHLQDGQPHLYWIAVPHRHGRVQSDATLLRYPTYRLSIDTADLGTVRGWMVRNDGADVLDLRLCWDGREIARAETSIVRNDVKNALDLHSVHHGFQFSFDICFPTANASLDLVDHDTDIVVARLWLSNRYAAFLQAATATSRTVTGRIDVVTAISPHMSGLVSQDTLVIDTMPAPRPQADADIIDVVIPIYGGAAETFECISSVLQAKNDTPCRLILVNDCSPDSTIQTLLWELEKRALNNLLIVHRTRNGGFSQSVNIGMALSQDRDVILLNADTVVQDHWIDRLRTAASSDARIGTVTPLSNNGEICTVPYMCKSLDVGSPELAKEVDDIAAQVNPGSITDLPVAIGFCMLIKRQCLAEIGYFDAEKWGRGYGEEVDFCLKAASRGWRNVLAGDIFVVHRGGVSFGDEKLQRILESSKKISAQYPFYDQAIQSFIKRDPARAVRRNINTTLLGKAIARPVVLHVTHAFGGGTKRYVSEMCALYQASGYENIVVEFDALGAASLQASTADAVTLHGLFADAHTEAYATNEHASLQTDLEKFDVRHVHLHTPLGVSAEIMAWLTRRYTFDITVHDYAWICPWVTLTGPDGKFHGDHVDLPASTYPAHPALQHWVDAAKGDIAQYRQVFLEVFNKARHVFVGAQDVATRMQRYGFARPYAVRSHPSGTTAKPIVSGTRGKGRRAGGRIRVGLIGGISDIKGCWRVHECAAFAHARGLPIDFMIFGNTSDDARFASLPNVEVLGRYLEKDLSRLLQKYRPDLLFFPNEWPETFSYVLNYAFDCRIWPVVTDLGAPAERVRAANFGSVIALDTSPDEVCRYLLALAPDTPQRLGNLPASGTPAPQDIESYIRGTAA